MSFHQVAASFKSLFLDDRVKSLVTPPSSDLVHSIRQTDLSENVSMPESWPDIQLIFGQDPDYQKTVSKLMVLIKKNVQRVEVFSEVENKKWTEYSLKISMIELAFISELWKVL